MTARTRLFIVCGLLSFTGCGTLYKPDRQNQATVRPPVDDFLYDGFDESGRSIALAPADSTLARAIAHYGMGLLHESETGRGVPRAVAEFEKAAQLDPKRHRLHSSIALSALYSRDVDKAILALERSCRENPDAVQPRMDLASTYHLAGRLDDALRHYSKLIRIENTFTPAYQGAASVLFVQKQDHKALQLLSTGLQKAEQTEALIEFCYARGRDFVDANEMHRAIPCFELVLRHRPSHRRELSYLLGELYEATGNITKASSYYRAAIEGDPPLVDAYIKLAFAILNDDPREAINILLEADQRIPKNPRILFLLACFYSDMDEFEKAIPLFESIEKTHKEMPERPLSPDFYLQYGDTLYRAGQVEKAESLFEQFQRLHPDDSRAWLYLAFLHGREKQFTKAIHAFEKIKSAAGEKPLSAPFYLHYGSALEQSGEKKSAEAVFEECLVHYPDNHEVLNYLAYMWAEDNIHLEKALLYVQRAIHLQPDNGAYVDTLGWIHFRCQEYDKALETIKRADKLMPDDPTINDHLGDIYEAMGKRKLAIRYWKMSLSLESGNKAVMEKLKNLGIEPAKKP